MSNLLAAESHFAFGENWKSFLNVIDKARVGRAEEALLRLFPGGELQGASMIDIGCGSGLSSLAAIKLGASHVECIDIDRASVDAASQLLSKFAPADRWTARVASVFDLEEGQYDIVYSWGVLHHTGDMWRAVEAAIRQVRPGGLFAIALYRKTPLCDVWKIEKAIYRKAPQFIQVPWRWLYMALYLLGRTVTGRNPISHIHNYKNKRGMNFSHDVHDWLGGYPYESASPPEVRVFFAEHGFTEERAFLTHTKLWGIFGSGCDEFVWTNA